MAFDTQFIHDLFGLHLPFFLKPGHRLFFLREYGVTDLAVSKPVLMGTVREGNRAPGTTLNLYIGRAFVLHRQAHGGNEYAENDTCRPFFIEYQRHLCFIIAALYNVIPDLVHKGSGLQDGLTVRSIGRPLTYTG